MKKKSIIVFSFFIWWFLTFCIVLVFIIPESDHFQASLDKYEQVKKENVIKVPEEDGIFRFGFTYGYLVKKQSSYLLLVFLIQTAITILLFMIIRVLIRKKPTSYLLPDPLESFKNILLNNDIDTHHHSL